MTIELSPKSEALIQKLIDRGDYHDPAAVIEEALQALIERDKLAQLRELIAVGVEQYRNGQVVEWTPDSLDRLKREAEEHIRAGKPVKDEVKP